MRGRALSIGFMVGVLAVSVADVIAADAGIRIKDLGRIGGVRDNMIVGYGIVSGLAGTGDSARSQATLQAGRYCLKMP